MGYRNLTCHCLGSAWLSLFLGQRTVSCMALLWSWLNLLRAISNKVPKAHASHNRSSLGSLSSDDQTGHNYNSSNSLGLYGRLPHNYCTLVGHSNHPRCRFLHLLHSGHCSKLRRACLLSPNCPNRSWYFLLTFPLTSYLRLSTWFILIIRPPHLEPKSSTTTFPLSEVDLVVTLPSTHH